MNTDNVSIAGETIDYGPCAFMDAYHPETVFSSIDRYGRYAYGKQPEIAGWNLARFGETLLPLFSDDKDEALKQANRSPAARPTNRTSAASADGGSCAASSGCSPSRRATASWLQDFFKVLNDHGTDFTLGLSGASATARARSLFEEPAAFDAWAARWPRADRVGTAGRGDAACGHAGHQPALHSPQPSRGGRASSAPPSRTPTTARSRSCWPCWPDPYEERPEFAAYAEPPGEQDQRTYRTFCGT